MLHNPTLPLPRPPVHVPGDIAVLFVRQCLASLGVAAALTFNLCLTSVVLQVVYPSNRTLPRTTLNGQSVGLQTENSLAAQLEQGSQQPLNVTIGETKQSIPRSAIGLGYDTTAIAREAIDYPLRERLIPFSFTHRNDVSSRLTIKDQAVFDDYVDKLAAASYPAVDASLKITDGKAVAQPASNGKTYQADIIKQRLLQAVTYDDVTITPEVTQPSIKTEVAQAAAERVTRQIQPVTLKLGNEAHRFEASEVGDWIKIVPQADAGTLETGFDSELITKSLETLAAAYNQPARATHVTVRDNVEIARVAGSDGRTLEAAVTADKIRDALNAGQTESTAVVTAIAPGVTFSKQYSRSSEGYGLLLQEIQGSLRGRDFAVTIIDPAANARASYNGGKEYHSASMYKIYMAYAILTKVQNGELSLGTPTSIGKSVNDCLTAMIVWSDNNCAIAFGDMTGWGNNDGLLRTAGFGQTTLDRSTLHTTADDTALYMQKLNNGQLLNPGHTGLLLDLMKRQRFRGGIPTGVAGTLVADKVGQLGLLRHDGAVIYSPTGTYFLAVYSYGLSDYQIASIARQVNAVNRGQ